MPLRAHDQGPDVSDMKGMPVERRHFLKAMGLGCIGCMCNPLSVFAASAQRTYSTQKLLKEYDATRDWRRDVYQAVPELDSDIDSVLDEMRDAYAAIIPDIPYIGERNFHLQWSIPNAQKLADYQVAKGYGVSIAQFSRLHLERALSDLMTMSEAQRRRIGAMQFGPTSDMMMRFVAWRSQLRLYPEDYILEFVPGDRVDFDWGLDYTQCPNVILFSRHGAADLVYPLVCTMDYVAGKALYVGYHRTMDIASGDPRCDLRWKQGVESVIPEI